MKQKKQLVVLVALLLTAGFIWFLYFDHDRPVVTADAVSAVQNYQPLGVENTQLHTYVVDRTRKTEYKSGGRNIFSREVPPPPAPVVSPLPVKFFGYGTVPNSASRLAFFTNGEDIHIVAEGELLLNRFRILKIGNVNLEYEEISSGLRGTAILEEQAAPPSP